MSKYDALWLYVQKTGETSLTFEKIEQIIGFPIDHSFLQYKRNFYLTALKLKKFQ